MAYNSNMPIGTPTPEEDLAGAKAGLLKAQAFAQEKENSRLGSVVPGPTPTQSSGAGVIIPNRNRYKQGGPVTGKYTKGTGAVNIGDWTAPLKSRR